MKFDKMLPLVSVIIPTYKREHFLRETINSVLNQTYPNIEIIIVDDDPESTIYRKNFLKNDKIRYFRNNKNRGASFCRNFGLKQARGDYIAFLDDDDLWLPSKIEKQINKFKSLDDEFSIVYTGYSILINGKIINRQNSYEAYGNFTKIVLHHCPFGSPTPLIKKRCFELIKGFDNLLPSCQDWDLWIRLSFECKCDFVPESLALYRLHGRQISTDVLRKIRGREIILNKYFQELIKYPKILSWHYRRLGSLYALTNNISKSRQYFFKSLKYNKLNYGTYIHLFLQLFNSEIHRWFIKQYGITKIEGIEIIS